MPADDGEKELVSRRSSRLQIDPICKCPKVISELTRGVNMAINDGEEKKARTWGIPVGCIPEKTIWGDGDTDFVETFRDDCCPSL